MKTPSPTIADAAALRCRTTIRPATLADAEEIARIHVETWRSAYADILPAAFLAELSLAKRLKGWKRNLTHHRRPSVQVAEIDGALAGWVSYGQCRDEGKGEANEAELYALYVDSEYQRTGVGSGLLAAAEAELVRLHPDASRVSLWVLELNTRGRAFYEARGYRPGRRAKEEPLGGRSFRELRYEKLLPASPPDLP